MASTLFVSGVLFLFLCVQLCRCAHKDIAQSKRESTLNLGSFPVPGNGRRAKRQDKTYNFRQPIYDRHRYYRLQTLSGAVADHWIELADDKKHLKLSHSGGGYDEVNATFEFQFYGHTIKRVYLSTAGVLSMSAMSGDEPPTHYIAQFLGHFNPNLHLDSAIYFESKGDKFIVEWRDVYLREPSTGLGPFTLETIVYTDGTIKFLYKKLPGIPTNVSFDNTLIIGLVGSINLEIAGIKLSVYYQAEFIDPQDLSEGDVVIFHPYATCDIAHDCHTCVSRRIGFDCKWCDLTKTCYDALDRYTKDFKDSGCATEVTSKCWSAGTSDEQPKISTTSSGSSSTEIAIIVTVILVLGLLGLLAGWSFYAYRNPDSPSGRWLIDHRPSQWKSLIFCRQGASKEEPVQPQY